jgi:multidrug transporter EmrE-like cation transporter
LARRLENTMAWIWLLLSGLMEIVWSVSLKFADGFTKFWPTVGTLVMPERPRVSVN